MSFDPIRSYMDTIQHLASGPAPVEEAMIQPVMHSAYSLIDAMRELREEGALIENKDDEFHTGGGLGLPFPGTYEQEYDMFKSKGPRRLTAMTNEDDSNTITLTQLYKQEKPDDNEQIWDYGTMIWDTPFEINKITPRELDWQLCHQYDVEDVEDLFGRMSDEQHEIVNAYINDPNLSNYIIVTDNGHIVDGNHRSIAAVLARKSLRYINIGEEDDDL